MLKMKTTFVDRANTNERVLQRANEMCKGKCEITPLSEQYPNSKIKSYAKHVWTAEILERKSCSDQQHYNPMTMEKNESGVREKPGS